MKSLEAECPGVLKTKFLSLKILVTVGFSVFPSYSARHASENVSLILSLHVSISAVLLRFSKLLSLELFAFLQ